MGLVEGCNPSPAMVCDSRVCLVRVDLEGVHNNKDGLVEISTKLMGQQNRVKVHREFMVCDGLLLCFRKNGNPLIWNPYLGQVRWIEPKRKLYISEETYCMGYDNKNNHSLEVVVWSQNC